MYNTDLIDELCDYGALPKPYKSAFIDDVFMVIWKTSSAKNAGKMFDVIRFSPFRQPFAIDIYELPPKLKLIRGGK